MNQTPKLLSGSVSLNALTHKLPMRFRVNMPLGFVRGSKEIGGTLGGEINEPWFWCMGLKNPPEDDVGVAGALPEG